MEDNQLEKSDYNEAVNQIFRLNDLWQKATNHRLRGEFIAWRDTLDAIWDELIADVEYMQKQNGKDDKTYECIYYKHKQAILNSRDDRGKQYTSLQAFSHFIRKVQDEAGKGAKRSFRREEEM